MHLNETVLESCSHLTPKYCQNHRKLILVCDMDETLLTELQANEKIILRPKIGYILKNLRNYYELCLVTYSTRERTSFILDHYLDPDNKLFGNRILCRDDIIPYFRNKLDAFFAHLPKSYSNKHKFNSRETTGNISARSSVVKNFKISYNSTNLKNRRPPVWTYIVILDDFPITWSNLNTCIPIRPFIIENFHRTKYLKNEKYYVLSLYKFLIKLYNAVFRDQRSYYHFTETSDVIPLTNLSANAVIQRIKRKTSQGHRFQTLCHLDPGHLINFDTREMDSTNFGIYTKSASNSIKHKLNISNIKKISNTNLENNGLPNLNSKLLIHNNLNENYEILDQKNRLLCNNFAKIQLYDSENTTIGTSEPLIRHIYKRAQLIRNDPI